MARAVEQQWPMTAEKRASVMQTLLDIVNSRDCDARDRISAARALLAADKQNSPQAPIQNINAASQNHLHLHVDSESLAERKRVAAELLNQLGFNVVGGDQPTDSQVVDSIN